MANPLIFNLRFLKQSIIHEESHIISGSFRYDLV